MAGVGACSTMARMCAPRACAVAAAAHSKGPLPATTIRWPSTGVPPLIKACSPPAPVTPGSVQPGNRSEEHTSELQSLMRISYAVLCLNKKRIQHDDKIDEASNCANMRIHQ